MGEYSFPGQDRGTSLWLMGVPHLANGGVPPSSPDRGNPGYPHLDWMGAHPHWPIGGVSPSSPDRGIPGYLHQDWMGHTPIGQMMYPLPIHQDWMGYPQKLGLDGVPPPPLGLDGGTLSSLSGLARVPLQ